MVAHMGGKPVPYADWTVQEHKIADWCCYSTLYHLLIEVPGHSVNRKLQGLVDFLGSLDGRFQRLR